MTDPPRVTAPGGHVTAPEAGLAATDTGWPTLSVQLLAIPDVAFVLTAAGLLTGAVWLAKPRQRKAGLAAATLLTTGVIGLILLPVSGAAALLLVLAAGNLVMEVRAAPGLLLHAAGGGVGLLLAGLCLHHPWSGTHPAVAVLVAVLITAETWRIARDSPRASTDPDVLLPRLIGREATVFDVDTQADIGHAVIAGRLWTIRDPCAPLREGHRVRVTDHYGHYLAVEQIPPTDRRC